jgi:glycosyltransferase 2 family protein
MRMRTKHWLALAGVALSIGLLITIFAKLDWVAFWQTLQRTDFTIILLVWGLLAINIATRALRWLIITGQPLREFPAFWEAGNIGYLGNTIYPARAGEALRIIAIHHFVKLPLGHALSSSFIDRLLDILILGLLAMLVVTIHGQHLLNPTLINVLPYFVAGGVFSIGMIVHFAQPIADWVESRTWQSKLAQKLQRLLHQAVDGLKTLKRPGQLSMILLITFAVYGLDAFIRLQIMHAMGWDLPLDAAFTVIVFVVAGSLLPSAPGYVGIYQVACVMALGFYHVSTTDAVAFSLIMQLSEFIVIISQGLISISLRSFNLANARREAESNQV